MNFRNFNVRLLPVFLLLIIVQPVQAEDGYRLWLRYDKIQNEQLLKSYRNALRQVVLSGKSQTMQVAQEELQRGLSGLLGQPVSFADQILGTGNLVVGTPESSSLIASLNLEKQLQQAGKEGYVILTKTINQHPAVIIASNQDVGVLHGIFGFLRLLQTHKPIDNLSITSAPKIDLRVLDHWYNLDGTAERGYAGGSIWDWHTLPAYIKPRYIDYARANASIGINGTVLNNVNSNALILTKGYLEKVAALADAFRPYGIKVYLSARFSAPKEIGGLSTADPLNPKVQQWWNDKANQIYKLIPDFGGFLVKANSEGQPGPQDYGRTHAQGANMLADALAPHGGIVMWRAFVYSNKAAEDRAKQAYNEFTPLDDKFRDNVLVQVKNGPIDFQPREPFHPLFGSMPKTPLMMEFQITQEYLGFATHLVYLGPLYKEVLESDTYAHGKGSTVAKVVDGSLENHKISGMAGVANIGTDRNWTGHPFAQANWYVFGRLAWNHELTSTEIADEWIRMTFTNDESFIKPVKKLMLDSREISVNYRTPLGLHHIMGRGSHYGPGPWVHRGRADWTAVYYHQADSLGIGFNRTHDGSNAVSQYYPPVEQKFNNLDTCPENLLLWFHHLSWSFKLNSGRNLWQGLVHHYYSGVDSVKWMEKTWANLKGDIDPQRYQHIKALLHIQEIEAAYWRDACVRYFQQFSGMPVPDQYDPPEHDLDYYENKLHKYVPGL